MVNSLYFIPKLLSSNAQYGFYKTLRGSLGWDRIKTLLE